MSKIVLGFSGGVDSAVSTMLLKKAGHEVYGLYMDNADEAARQCAIDAAEFIGVPLTVLDVKAELERNVCRPFTEAYLRGETPNPCIICNPSTKFKNLLAEADRIGAELVATGHYVRRVEEADGTVTLHKALDADKEQSYVLYNMTQEQLRRTLFPLGALTKTEVREIAQREGFLNAKKHDSQDICFVPDGDYAAFIQEYTGKTYTPGPVYDVDGNKLGTHRGIIHYTIGQRKGLGLALGKPMYVKATDAEKNTVTLATNDQLFSSKVYAENLNWIAGDVPSEPKTVVARVRYHGKDQPATLHFLGNGNILADFQVAQRAVTPGQAIVFYQGDQMLGGAEIVKGE